MKKLLTILFGAFMVVAAYGQYPEVEELDDGATFGEQRTKINDDIRLDNQQSDSLADHLVRLEGIGDSLAVHNLIIWNNTDAIAGQKDDLTYLTADVDANNAAIGVNAGNISTNVTNISTNVTNISNNSDSLGVHLDMLQSQGAGIDKLKADLATTNNTISENSEEVGRLAEDVKNLSEYTISLNEAGNALVFTSLTGEYTVIIDTAVVEDKIIPYYESSEIGTVDASTIVLSISEDLNEDSISPTTAFTVTTSLGDEQAIVTNVSILGSEITLSLDSALNSGENISLTYTPPTSLKIQDEAGNTLHYFKNTVTNNIELPDASLIALYLFENNQNQEPGGNGGISLVNYNEDPPNYTTDPDAIMEGDYALHFSPTAYQKSEDSYAWNDEWTMSMSIYQGTTANAPMFYIPGYLNVYVDYEGDDYVRTTTLSGGTQTGSSTNLTPINYVLTYVTIRYRLHINGEYYMSIWVNGVNSTADSIVGDCSNMSGIFYIGTANAIGGSTSRFDALHLYDEALTGEQIRQNYSEPSIPVSGSKGDAPVTDTSEFTLLFSHTFDDTPLVARGYKENNEGYDPEADDQWFSANFNEDERTTYCMAIVEDPKGSGNSFANYYDEGHSGDGPDRDINTYTLGTGTYFSTRLEENMTGYKDVYFSYNVLVPPGFYVGETGTITGGMKMNGLQSPTFRSTTSCAPRFIYQRWHTPEAAYYAWYLKDVDSYYLDNPWRNNPAGTTDNKIEDDGEWHNVCMRVSLNHDGQSDGFYEFFYDGQHIRTDGDWKITIDEDLTHMIISTSGNGSGDYDIFSNSYVLLYDDFTAWIAKDGGSYPAWGTKSEPGRILRNAPAQAHIFDKGEGIHFCGIGNSIMKPVTELVGEEEGYFATTLATSGDDILDQLDKWNAMDAALKLEFDYVAVSVGINDVIFESRTYALMVSWYQQLLAAIKADTRDDCQVIHFTMTQIKAYTGYDADMGTKHLQVNSWIENNLTNVDLPSTAFYDSLGDTDPTEMNPIYMVSPTNIHPNNAGYLVLKQQLIDAIQSLE